MNSIDPLANSSSCKGFSESESSAVQFAERALKGKIQILNPLTSFSNKNLKIQDALGKIWVLRVPNSISFRLCCKKDERRVLEWASQQGFSALEIGGYDENRGYLITKFLDGKNLSANDFQNPAILNEALALLQKLHECEITPIVEAFNPLERYEVTRDEAARQGIYLPTAVQNIGSQLIECLKQIPRDRFRQVACHNDPSPENFFRQGGQLYLHDWELAKINDPMWDIAHFSALSQIDIETIFKFYRVQDPLARDKVALFQAFVFFNSLVWASLEREFPTSFLPKEVVERIYHTFLDKCQGILTSASFKEALNKLIKGTNPMSITPVLSTSPDSFPNFQPRTQISTLFLENAGHLLLLMRCHKEDQPDTWGIPGGKAEKEEEPINTVLRELNEETQIRLSPDQVVYHGHRYARIPNWDYIVHIYSAVLQERPPVILDPREHSKYEWVSMYAFKLMPLLQGQGEVFDIVYKDRLWQRVDPRENPQLQRVQDASFLVLRKGNQFLTFNRKRRFILNLIGTSGSGKGTQGEMLSRLFMIPNVSAGDLFRDEFRGQTKLGEMVQTFDQRHYPAYLPDEIPIGMMAKRLANRDCQNGFILDGFPRTETQGDVTREVFFESSDFHVPLFMDVPESDIWQRLPGRSICNECGHQVRALDDNPTPGFCPEDAKKGKKVPLEKRIEDIDRSKTERRLKMFSDNQAGILRSMSQRDPIAEFKLNNQIPPREVLHQLCSEIQTRLDRLSRLESPSFRNIPFWAAVFIGTFVARKALMSRSQTS